MFALRLTFSCLMVTRSFVLKKQKKNTRHPTTPKIIITIRNPSASLPFPNLSTSVRAKALTTVEPMDEKKVLQDARTVLSCGSSLSAGRIDAIGIFTTVYAVESRM